MGIPAEKLGFDKLYVDAKPLLQSLKLI